MNISNVNKEQLVIKINTLRDLISFYKKKEQEYEANSNNVMLSFSKNIRKNLEKDLILIQNELEKLDGK